MRFVLTIAALASWNASTHAHSLEKKDPRTTHIDAPEFVRLRVTRVPHLNADSPLKPDNMDMASFDKAGKAS